MTIASSAKRSNRVVDAFKRNNKHSLATTYYNKGLCYPQILLLLYFFNIHQSFHSGTTSLGPLGDESVQWYRDHEWSLHCLFQ